MNEELPEPLQRLLAEVAAGDRPPDDPEVLAHCAADPRFAAELAELSAIAAQLEALGARERAAVATPAELRLPRPDLRPPGRRIAKASRRWLLAGLAAAAAALAVVSWWPRTTAAPDDDRRTLGAAVLELLPPTRQGDQLLLSFRCRWADASFEVTVYDPDAADTPLLARPLADERLTTWTLTAEQTQQLHPGLRWRVQAVAGDLRTTADAPLRW